MDSVHTVKRGKLLYNGISLKHKLGCPRKFIYKKGQKLNSKTILYLTPSLQAAIGYAGGCGVDDTGWVRAYKTTRDLRLKDVTVDQMQYEVDEVIEEICPDYDGYYLQWRSLDGSISAIEIVVCNVKRNLRWTKTVKCAARGRVATSKCGRISKSRQHAREYRKKRRKH